MPRLSLGERWARQVTLLRLLELEREYPDFGKLYEEDRHDDFPLHTPGSPLHRKNLDANEYLCLRQEWAYLSIDPDGELIEARSTDSTLASKIRQHEGVPAPKPTLMKSDPDIVKRFSIIYQNRNKPASELCKLFDFHHVPLLEGWNKEFGVKDWKSAYQNRNCRKRVDTLISKDRKKTLPA